MTQATIIRSLQNGPLTSLELEELTGLPRTAILAACKKLRYKDDLTVKQVRVGRFRVAQYTLKDHMIDVKKTEEPRCLLNPFDIRNAKGIFTPAEYKAMNAHARRLYSPSANEITNNQYI